MKDLRINLFCEFSTGSDVDDEDDGDENVLPLSRVVDDKVSADSDGEGCARKLSLKKPMREMSSSKYVFSMNGGVYSRYPCTC